ncbi:glucose-1-phosphate cytidylyltransferase [Granulicella sp. 5B5]|uniref:glucose-1-phosphate cytidylyltransferase n=1 Tax=Granulicella sp. 5B5 TaxID=1617967 RepID=UPI0015F3FF84|nr:glucose-1-phosphate cytidylyltransferase [Granulicella sp. 5B5]QMV19100.1 glucose-1-phosphate cytidylyltransferase [Granulicella sp. 5B5]
MKAIILAGGLGSRLSEETTQRPKPMVEIGGYPILWHIMKIYSTHNVNDFIVCLGYKGYSIKEYFANYFLHSSDVTFDIAGNSMEVHSRRAEPWRVTLVDTGNDSQTGGRIKRVLPYVQDDPAFCLTYGDGVGDIDISASIRFHQQHGKLATMTTAQPSGRFGSVVLQGDSVLDFYEKPIGDGQWVNAGFFVLSPKIGDYIAGDSTAWEQQSLPTIAREGQLQAFRHRGFWQPMDTLRDKNHLEDLWSRGKASWKIWP